MSLQDAIDAALDEGYEIIQEGRVVMPAKDGVAFSERARGFQFAFLGTFSPPLWQSQYDNKLIDDGERWVHLRRNRRAS